MFSETIYSFQAEQAEKSVFDLEKTNYRGSF